ncbi:hypothetical protein C1Y40_00316 [Mycobacterium talmoniae]|uniref:Uncharacterized protein n=1 Tax=Mycobacterium talmoniae TaxID=1858794 RepID=A0A2S8BS57_9MYCO|nr:hypothetical protein C1Y40_00316 [Mycobacterium talmoniae]
MRGEPGDPVGQLGHRAQPGDTGQPRVGPVAVVQFPDSRLGLLPPRLDRGRHQVNCSPPVGRKAVGAGGGRQQLQRISEGVELELAVHPVSGLIGAAGVAGQVERRFIGHRAAGSGVGGFEVGSVVQHPCGDELGGRVEQVGGTGHGGGQPRVALVADPHVAVVVVLVGVGPLRQAGGRGGDHTAGGAGQSAQHRPGVGGVVRRDGVGQVRPGPRPRVRGGLPGQIRVDQAGG